MKAKITSVPLYMVATWELLQRDYAITRADGQVFLEEEKGVNEKNETQVPAR